MPPSVFRPGDSCTRSRLPGWLRLTIAFAVLFALRDALPRVGVAPAFQVLILLLVATGFAWRFWWNCSPDRRGVAALVVMLWAAGLLKVLRM